MNTIGYISDNMFYRLNVESGQTEIQLNPRGRSYQAFTGSAKRGLVVLADYGKNPYINFQYLHRKEGSYEMRDVCALEIDRIALSLDCRYLLVSCGLPEQHIMVVDVENRRALRGEESMVRLADRKVLRIEFNPSNNRIFGVMFADAIQVYQIVETFSNNGGDGGRLQENIRITKKCEIPAAGGTTYETFSWDQINNIYASNGRTVFVFSTDTEKQVISYDLQGDFQGQVLTNFILTQKHVILVYCNGRMQWINKYYPDLMQEQQTHKKPFYLDKFYQFDKLINYACYNHDFSKIIIAHKKGFFSVMSKQAQSTENEDQQQENRGGARNPINDRKIEAEIALIGPYHANQIVFCREVKDKALLMTISKAGRMVLWSTIEKRYVAFLETALDVAAADVNSDFTLLCTSNHKGVVQFYQIRDFENIILFKQFKLCQQGSINQIQFSSNSKQVACLSTQNKRIFYILTDESQQFQILGHVNLPYKPYSICWNKTTKVLIKPKFEHLLVCIGFGIVMINGPPATSVKLRGKEFEIGCEMYGLRTDLEQRLIEVLPTGEIVSTGADKMIKKYKQLEEPLSKFNPEAKSPIPPPLEQIEAHDLQITFMKVSNRFFISGGADGTLQIRALDNFNAAKSIHVCGWKNANLSTGAVSEVDGLYFACGKDGALSMWKTKDLQIKASDQPVKDKPKHQKINTAGNNLKYFEAAIEDEYAEKMKQTIAKKKKDQLQKITKIKAELKQLLAQNEAHEELEKLSRDQFVIDLEHRDRMTKIGLENCQKIKKESMRNVLCNEVYRNKLKQITWDIMQQHLRAINGIKNNYIVYNYQIRKLTYEEKRKVQLIMDLRRNQLKQLKKRGTLQAIDPQFYKNKNIINGGVLQPLILTVLEKKDDKKQEKGKKKKEKEEQAQEKKPDEVEQIPKDEVWQLLYSSFELFSDNAKKNQIILMKNVITKIKEAFNRQFNKLLKLRQSQNEIINDKNKTIIEICEELKRSHQVIISKKNILENPERILEVNNKDIPFARYLSRQQREKLEKQRLKEQERLRALAEDDASQRALQKMMGGTLEEKKTSVLEVTVEREKWMDKPIEQMSEDQKNKLKEYQQKRQKAEQEKQRIVKKLEAELRKLKLQIDDIMEKYDQKLFALLRRRIQYDLRIEEQELYCIKLALSITNYKTESSYYNQLKNKQKYYQERIEQLQIQKKQLSQNKQQLQRQKQSKKGVLDMKRLGDSQGRIKVLQTNTFDQYHNNIKKKRQLEQNLLKNDLIAQYQIIKLDPMKQLQSKILAHHNEQQIKYFIPDKKAFIEANQISESIYNMLEARFNARKEEGQYERKLKGIINSLAAIEEAINRERGKEEADQRELKNIENYLKQSKSDLQVLFRIKKGFVQIDSEKPVPLLNDALLIGKNQIDQKNQLIQQKATLKINVMKDIKTCKIQVTESTLNLERQQALINELSTMIKQVQMLKVKKEMQTALAKKDTKINQNQLRSLKQQIEKVRKQGQKRISLFQKKIQKVNQQIDSIKKENKQLQVQKWNLENTVKQREKIKDMMVGENGKGNEEAAEKFQQISINRKLFDKAKQQTDQIQLLREELSKLKAKTFANFSSVQR